MITKIDGLPAEIQVRTELQDTWAQTVERLADRWGRGIRYGSEPENPDALVRLGRDIRTPRREVIEELTRLSDTILDAEENRRDLRALEDELRKAVSNVRDASYPLSAHELVDRLQRDVKRMGMRLTEWEQAIRGILRVTANATDEGA